MPEKDELGDKCKAFELEETSRSADKNKPLIARLDGRSFSTFTRGLSKPFDTRMMDCMRETTSYLVREFNPFVGYTQSDEITLVWLPLEKESKTELPFGGKYHKLTSVLAGAASAKLTEEVSEQIPEKILQTPHFDCRVWQVPSIEDVRDVLRWRVLDSIKNSVSGAARYFYSHKVLQDKSHKEKLEMLEKKGIIWGSYPTHFKTGIFLQRKTVDIEVTEEMVASIPIGHRPSIGSTIQRTKIEEVDNPLM